MLQRVLISLSIVCLAALAQAVEHAPLALPKDQTDGLITVHEMEWWTTGWSSANRTPIWVAYHLPYRENIQHAASRPSGFKQSTLTDAPHDDDYEDTGYHRGHLAPNHALAALFGADAQRATFTTSNIAPQPPSHNSGPWRVLESHVLKWSQERGGLWVVTGLAYDSHEEDLPKGVEIPDAWWKVILDEHPDGSWAAIAFYMPEDTVAGTDPLTLRKTVDYIEAKSGLDLLSGLPDQVEDLIEASDVAWEPAPPIPDPVGPNPHTPQAGAVVNINTATQSELESLPGIGPALAQRIIAARPFDTLDDLTRVSGIGDKTLERIRGLLTH